MADLRHSRGRLEDAGHTDELSQCAPCAGRGYREQEDRSRGRRARQEARRVAL